MIKHIETLQSEQAYWCISYKYNQYHCVKPWKGTIKTNKYGSIFLVNVANRFTLVNHNSLFENETEAWQEYLQHKKAAMRRLAEEIAHAENKLCLLSNPIDGAGH